MNIRNEKNVIRVCVIGAGAAGLCAARHLARDPNIFEFIVFEQTPDIGGTWVYTDQVGLNKNGLPIHSSMYKNLRTNLPKEIMNFPDYCEIKGNASCVSHYDILKYLKDYSEHFHLRRFIRFETLVESVKIEKSSSGSSIEKWMVKVKDLKSSESQVLTFDAIIICNGHYFDPHIPNIDGLENFQGQILHSHNYREPDIFAGKSVILLGASSSGVDIAFELSDKASHVYLSHNNERLISGSSSNITEINGIDRYIDNQFLLKDGSTVKADILILCTGYLFSYSFLHKSCEINVDDNYVFPLFKHLININHPTMCFIGIPMAVVPFPMFHMQVQYFLSVLKGTTQLPSKLEQLKDSKARDHLKKRHAHKLAYEQWEYNDDLARCGGFEPLPSYYKRGYEMWSNSKWNNLQKYKKFILVIDNSDAGIVRIVDPRA